MVGRFFICLERREEMLVGGEGNRGARPYWRKGHNREARRRLFRYVFDELSADRIETGAWAGNESSIRSIEAHGFRFDRDKVHAIADDALLRHDPGDASPLE